VFAYVPGIPGRYIPVMGVRFRCALFVVVPWWIGRWLGIRNLRKIQSGSCFRCAVFGVVPGWIGVWLPTKNPRKRKNYGPVADVRSFLLFLGGLGSGCVTGIPGRDIFRVLFHM
jgi:hypothetical protein